MAKSWLVAKRLRMKIYRTRKRGVKERRSSEMVNAGRTISKEGMSELYIDAVRGLGVTTKQLQDFNHRSISEPRQAALELLVKMDSAEPLRYFRLLDDAFARARLYYSSNPEYCHIVELDHRTKVHRRSIKYLSRDIAYGRYCDDTIDWSLDFYHPLILETH